MRPVKNDPIKPLRSRKFFNLGGPVSVEEGDPKKEQSLGEKLAELEAIRQSKQLPKYEQANNFLNQLYRTERVRNQLSDNLSYRHSDDINSPVVAPKQTPFSEASDFEKTLLAKQADAYRQYTLGRNTDLNYSDFPEAARRNSETLDKLMLAFPERFNSGEFFTYRGMADGVADLMGDWAGGIGSTTYDFAMDMPRTVGSTGRQELINRKLEGQSDKRFYQENPDETIQRNMTWKEPSTGQSSSYRSPMGRKGRPYVMGLAGPMERQNQSVIVDQKAGFDTYVHELSHAGDLGRYNIPYNMDMIEQFRRENEDYVTDMEREEFLKNFGENADLSGYIDYVTTPSETLARANVLRNTFYNEFGDKAFNMDYTSPAAQAFFDKILNDETPKGAGQKSLQDLLLPYTRENVGRILNEMY